MFSANVGSIVINSVYVLAWMLKGVKLEGNPLASSPLKHGTLQLEIRENISV
jgi:hypothetical protein